MKPTLPNIPVFKVPDKPLGASTQKHLPIAEIVDNLVLYKDGGAAMVLESTSLNFGLLSEKEQQAVIFSYAALLNSLAYSIQILVRSQKKDISSYLNYLDLAAANIKSPKLSALMHNYRNFITETIKKKNVLGKHFYIVIPFSSLELGVAKSALAITKKSGPLPFTKSYTLAKAKTILVPKKNHIIRQANRLGLKLKQLSNDQLIELFYDFYNPKKPISKKSPEQPVGSQEKTNKGTN